MSDERWCGELLQVEGQPDGLVQPVCGERLLPDGRCPSMSLHESWVQDSWGGQDVEVLGGLGNDL